MKKLYLMVVCTLLVATTFAQNLLSWTPEFPTDNSNIVITMDANKGNQGLLNFEGGNSANVYVHIGVITSASTSSTDWRYVPFAWASTTGAARATALGNNKYSYTINNIRTFFNVPAGETILKIAILFRNASGSLKQVNADGSDMYIPIYTAGQLKARLNLPPREPRFVPWLEPITASIGSTIPITGVSSIAANLTLRYNGTVIGTASNATTITANATVSTNCDQQIILEAVSGTSTSYDTINFYIPPTTTVAALPAGVKDGINYSANNTEATLVLYAPNKNNVVVIGGFNNWTSSCAYQMNKTPDGTRYWIKLTGLTPGQIYGFQYIVDGTIRTTDPYTELVLDPWNDSYIPAANYPNMPAYPTNFTSGIVGTLQTAAPTYTWSNNAYTRPDKRNLIVYELLMRDFLANPNWQTVTDTLNYLKNLGINCIELMPITEFDGNLSWGYNNSFFFAPDKYYGTKNNLKRFIDSAHSKGMAVIIDAVFNHVTGSSPLAQLYWNPTTNQPSSTNPWLNVSATHPFSVFNDFNHESEATKYHVARFMRHWLTEYKIDGFRWDLSKGFTQKPCGSDIACWNTFDQTRINIWQRYMDSAQAISPNTYMILEHLGNDDEESNLANRGFMLWGHMNTQYNQNTMGFVTNSDINRAHYANRPGWNQPHLVTYAESHDEERLMYKNLNFGNNSNASHDVRVLNNSLKRMEAMYPMLLLLPGPKMIWQFGELGYDKSIFMCTDGTVPTPYGTDNCKLSEKPILWNYNNVPERKRIYNVVSKLNNLRRVKPNAFTGNYISGNLGADLKKVLIINHSELKVVAISNFDVTAQTFTVTFPSAETYWELFDGSTVAATGSSQTFTLNPGDYRVWTNMAPCGTAAPTATTTINYCQGATATALTATGSNLLWYTTATGGTGSATAPVPSTSTVGSTTYYVSQTVGCESMRTAITVVINATPATPTATNVNYCQGSTATPLIATGTNLLWYTSATGGTGTPTAPTPSTASTGTTTYYVTQTVNGCTSTRAALTVTVNAIPAAPVASNVAYCQGSTATALTATGNGLLWYTAATGGTGSSTAPVPSTSAAGTTNYYVSQTVNGCESPRTTITVTINATPAAPGVSSPVIFCQNQTATALTATGSNLKWYTTSTGGTGSTTAPIPTTTNVGSTSYFVSQTVNGCEGPRAEIVVNITTSTPAPIVTSPVNYCQGQTATSLTANGSNLKWYTSSTGGTGSSTAPTPNTSATGSTSYFVSQTTSCGEGPRAEIIVTVTATPGAPTVVSPVVLCQGVTASALTATGSNLKWYTVATGGTALSSAPVPNTSNAGSTVYYVSQSTGTCEGPRAAITVTINPTPAAPTVNSSVTYCQNQTATALTASGNNLLWYTTATGGTGSSTAPVPSTTTTGTTTYYVSQTQGNCEGPRAAITVTVNPLASVPAVVSPVTYCLNQTATALSATGTNLLWYTSATGGTGSTTAPVPSTSTVGTTTYYVSQSNNCGESVRSAVVVTVTAGPAAPTGFSVSNITTSGAVVSWTSTSGAFYTVEYKEATASNWSTAANGITANSVTLTGLRTGVNYQVRISATCTQTGTNNNYLSGNFTTLSRDNSISNVKNGLGIKISPNPVSGTAFIDYVVPANGRVDIAIYNAKGQVAGYILRNNGRYVGQYTETRSLQYLAKGVYVLRIVQGELSNYVTFIKE